MLLYATPSYSHSHGVACRQTACIVGHAHAGSHTATAHITVCVSRERHLGAGDGDVAPPTTAAAGTDPTMVGLHTNPPPPQQAGWLA